MSQEKMKKVNELIKRLSEKEKNACLKALELVNIEPTIENMEYYYNNIDYLTINRGRNGKLYAWYLDDNHNVAVNIDTLNELTDKEIENQFC